MNQYPNTKAEVIALHKKGLTYRKIMAKTGLKSPSSVSHHLKYEHSHSLYQLDEGDGREYGCRGCDANFRKVG